MILGASTMWDVLDELHASFVERFNPVLGKRHSARLRGRQATPSIVIWDYG